MKDLIKTKREFFKYAEEKSIGSLVFKKFVSSMNIHIKSHPDSFINFWNTVKFLYELPIERSLRRLNKIISEKDKGYETFLFLSEWSNSYLGPGEIISLLLIKESISGKRKKPDILYKDSNRKIEVKSYLDNFRLSESTYFSTDLGTIVQALVQGGFLHSLTDLNLNDLKKGLRHFSKAFTCPKGYIELNYKIWKLHSRDSKTIVFKLAKEVSKELVNYSIVRNSLRNWIGRGVLSLRLASIIDPTRTKRIPTNELNDYINSLLGSEEFLAIPLEQYFILSDLESLLVYDRRDKKNPFSIYKLKDLKKFRIDRIAQAKVSYKKIEKAETLGQKKSIKDINQIQIKMEKNSVKTSKTKKTNTPSSKRNSSPVSKVTPTPAPSKPNPVAVTPVSTERTRKSKTPKLKTRNRISVFQLSLKGKKIKKFNSFSEAFVSTGVNTGSISKAVRGITKSAGGYKWEQVA
jgi:hypothetical protein